MFCGWLSVEINMAEFWNLFTGMAMLKLSTTVLKLSRGHAKCVGVEF